MIFLLMPPSLLPLQTPELDTDTPTLTEILLSETSPFTQLNAILLSSATKKDPILFQNFFHDFELLTYQND